MRSLSLTVVKGGVNRLRVKGAARADSLYDLLNGYVTAARTVRVRPGTIREASLPVGTVGLCAFQGELHVFAAEVIGGLPPGYVLHVLVHPNAESGSPIAITEIHFAEPFMGFLYVVAEFVGGDVFHYWMQSSGPWQANKIYKHGDIVEPTIPNGLAYQATRLGAPFPSWAPNVPRTEGPPPDVIEPTVYNDFFYTVVETIGANPASGTVEPDWPEEDGARIFEDTEGFTDDTPVATQPPSTQTPSSSVTDRYDYNFDINIPFG